jgi:hypothetical protein
METICYLLGMVSAFWGLAWVIQDNKNKHIPWVIATGLFALGVIIRSWPK